MRHRGKIESTISNAARVIDVQASAGSLDVFVWSFVGGAPIVHDIHTLGDLPTATAESAALSKELKQRGFRFVGPTTVYAFMQAAGLVDDHVAHCFRRS